MLNFNANIQGENEKELVDELYRIADSIQKGVTSSVDKRDNKDNYFSIKDYRFFEEKLRMGEKVTLPKEQIQRIEVKDYVQYHFETDEPIFVEESDDTSTSFVLHIDIDGMNISQGSCQDYACYESARNSFDIEDIYRQCIETDHTDIDMTKYYLDWLEEWVDECQEEFNLSDYLWRFTELSDRAKNFAVSELISFYEKRGTTIDEHRAIRILMSEHNDTHYYIDGRVYFEHE